jgi:Putative peptidoglycan binding domain/Domain of unknown function (DUF4347)
MIFLQRGDKLPTVAAMQSLLNARIGNSLRVDGYYGPVTQTAVKNFQQMTGCSGPSGIVDNLTWFRLNRSANLTVVDIVDICDPGMMEGVDRVKKFNHNSMASESMSSAVVLGCMSNAVEDIVNQVTAQNSAKSVVLLRFDGHGNVAVQGTGIGHGVDDIIPNAPKNLSHDQEMVSSLVHRYSSISGGQKGLKYVKEFILRLKPLFSSHGSIEFHGCQIAKGAEGVQFLHEISDITGVPVTASVVKQFKVKMHRFLGHYITACPDGKDLACWAASRPVAYMSLP